MAKCGSGMRMQSLLKNAFGITAIGRHSIKGKTPSGLSPGGEAKASWSGGKLPKGFTVFARFGDQARHKSTAQRMVKAYPGKKKSVTGPFNELGFKCIKDMPALEKMIDEKGDPKVLADWVDGKISTKIFDPAEKVGKALLQGALKETHRVMPERPFYLNLTSSWFEAAALKVLGIDYRSIKPRKGRAKEKPSQGQTLKETEALLFFHLPDGRTILAYRGRRFDITKRVNEIVSAK